jgi:FKBP-type peptidyl-prolyl cis-trans isomerase SlyD
MPESRVEPLKVVYITYRILDHLGQILDQVDLPVGYIHGGRSDLFPQIERELAGCEVGDTVDVTLTPDEAFGRHQPGLTFTDAIENVPPEYRRVGAEASFQSDRGETMTMTVTRVQDGKVILDGNHPLAGKTITFRVTVTDIRDATPEEIARGVPEGTSLPH